MWPDLESNQGHKDFQSFALPTELPGHVVIKAIKMSYVKLILIVYYYKVCNNFVMLSFCFQIFLEYFQFYHYHNQDLCSFLFYSNHHST
jgi:hypothetical protein